MQKFEFLRQPFMGELAMSRKKKEEREKMPPTFMPAAKGSARTPLGPIFYYGLYVLEADAKLVLVLIV